MRTGTFTSTAVVLALLTFAGSAAAQPGYVQLIPNGSAQSCGNCHPGSDTSKLSAFANSFQTTHAWSAALAMEDSDGDQQSNGEELGDPCGTWMKGGTAERSDDISNPSDPTSKAASATPCGGTATGTTTGTGATPDPTTGSTAAGPGTPKPPVQTGACASIAPIGTGGTLGALWLAFGAMAIRRRLQRKG